LERRAAELLVLTKAERPGRQEKALPARRKVIPQCKLQETRRKQVTRRALVVDDKVDEEVQGTEVHRSRYNLSHFSKLGAQQRDVKSR
jgi:hypothetical protein